MSQNLASAALDHLKDWIGSLKDSGEDGFEGFLAHILADHSNRPVRIARSGAQFGQDAVGTDPSTIISIEAKLYSSTPKKSVVLSKPTELISKPNPPDLWILGITANAGSQISDTIQEFCKLTGIASEILDWPATGSAPPLAAYCLLAPEAAIAFLLKAPLKRSKANFSESSLREAFRNLKRSRALVKAKNALAERISAPSIGVANAVSGNRSWLMRRFESNSKAKSEFGQKLAPFAPAALPLQDRRALVEAIRDEVFETPPGAPIFLVGGQGSGKSWAFVSAWHSASPILTVIVTANEAAQLQKGNDTDKGLINLIMRQTGAEYPDLCSTRWRRRFARWRQDQTNDQPRIVIYIDGINQREDLNWPVLLGRICQTAQEIGGQVCISVRPSQYSRQRFQLPEHTKTIVVRTWSDSELRAILKPLKIDVHSLPWPVVETLKIPRLCAIGFEMKRSGTVRKFEELTVGRLLHEQIMSGADQTETPSEIQKSLQQHAEEVLQRNTQQHPDPLLFDSTPGGQNSLSARLNVISQDGYFRMLPEDNESYEIRSESLTLGLAISLTRQLQRVADRSGDIEAVCADKIEAISAVDETASIVLDALTLCATDRVYSSDVVRTLLLTYLELQNIETSSFDAFSSLARYRPGEFLQALKDVSETSRATFNHDWLLTAAINLADDAEARPSVKLHIEDWLSRYTLDPSISARDSKTFSNPSQAAIDERAAQIDASLRQLTEYEREVLGEMINDPSLVSFDLFDDAMLILHQFDLAGFSRSLLRHALALNLNSPRFHSSRDFGDLISFNRRDWTKTRDAIRREVKALEAADPSETGKRVMVTLLFATSDPEDAKAAEEIRDSYLPEDIKQIIRRGQPDRGPDPCDPTSLPDAARIGDTVSKIENLNPANWRTGLGATLESSTIGDALPTLARFAADRALAAQHRLFEETLDRTGDAFKFAIFDFYTEGPALSPGLEDRFIRKAHEIAGQWKPDQANDHLVAIQYALLMAIAGRDGNAQIKELSALPGEMPLILVFDEVIQVPDPDTVERILEDSVSKGGSNRIVTILRFSARCGTAMTKRTIEMCEQLLEHDKSTLRAYAMAALIESKDKDAYARFAKGGWSAPQLDRKSAHFERWYGGLLLIMAAQSDLIPYSDLMNRIGPSHYAHALNRLDGQMLAPLIADAVDRAVMARLSLLTSFEPPVILRAPVDPRSMELELVSLEDRPRTSDRPVSLSEVFKMPCDGELKQEHKSRSDAYEEFRHSMSEQEAEIFLGDLGYETISACYDVAPERIIKWANMILDSEPQNRRALKNFGLHVARCISKDSPDTSRNLFELLLGTDGYVRIQSGRSKTPYEQIAVWLSATSDKIVELCFNLLDACSTDKEISECVTGAMLASRDELLECYVEERMESGEPMLIARALTVSGYSRSISKHYERFLELEGPIGQAAKSARKAMNEYEWSRHWWDEMLRAGDRMAYWRASLLLRQCADGRIDALSPEGTSNTFAEPFNSVLRQKMSQVIKKRLLDRDKNLFGRAAPKHWYVHDTRS